MVREIESHVEQLVEIRGRGIGEASEQVVRVGEMRGYTVVASGPGTFRLVRSKRPKWAVALAVLFAPALGLGLLFLLIRKNESGVVTVYEDRAGVKARVVGEVDSEIVQFLAQSEQTTPATVSPVARAAPAVPIVPVQPPASQPEMITSAAPGWTPRAPEPQPRSMVDADVDRTIARPRAAATGPVLVIPGGATESIGNGIVIGRSPQAAGPWATARPVVVADQSVSSTHAALVLGDGCVVVTDLHSTYGTVFRVDGVVSTCPAGDATAVPFGAEIVAGEAVLLVKGEV